MGSQHVIDVEESQFQLEVLERSRELPVVVDFWAPWCGPCRTLGPLLEAEIEALGGTVLLAKVNVDRAQGLAQAFRVSGIPAVKAFRDGRVVAEFVGAQPKAKVHAFVAGLVPAEPAVQQEVVQEKQQEVRQKLRSQAEEIGSEQELQAVLGKDPKAPGALYGLALYAAAEGRFEAALESLLELVGRDRKWNDEAPRKSMLEVFEAIGSRSELAEEYRGRLAMILF